MVLQDALRAATQRLRDAGIESARVDAELLLAHVLGVERGALILAPDLPEPVQARFGDLIHRRALGSPLQYLTGRAPFRYLELQVGPGVFIPRPETELLVELVAADLADGQTVVDLGAGSGALALSIAHEFRSCRVLAVERSASARDWLGRNAADRSAAGDPAIEIVAGDLTDSLLLGELTAAVDVVVSNPPYVPAVAAPQLRPEVAHDPAEAVFAGADGLAVMPGLLATAARLLRPGGRLAIEHDDSHAVSLPSLLDGTGQFEEVVEHLDLNGRPRFVTARRMALQDADPGTVSPG
jgi:release factor glutamine methyltransferase